MNPELIHRLESTRRRLRRLALWHGIYIVAAVLIVAVLSASILDWLFHVSSELRLILLGTVVGVTGWFAYRRIIVPTRWQISNLDLALRVERLHPELEETLSSTIDFGTADRDDPKLGSAELRQAVVDAGLRRSEPIDFHEIINPRPQQIAGRWALAASMLAILVMVTHPQSSAIALQRLVNPWTGPEWPRKTRFAEIIYRPKMAKGDPFVATVAVEGVIPERMTTEFRFADGTRPAPTTMVVSVENPNRFVVELDAATQPFEFLVQGGDAQSDWQPVDVAPAPDVEQLSIELTPPAYTHRDVETLPPGRGHIRSVVGTNVRLTAKSNKPIRAGRLVWADEAESPGVVLEDGLSLVVEFNVTKDDTYRILLEDTGGMTNEHRSPKQYRVEAVADAAPEVTITEPTADLDVTASARPMIRFQAVDDFGLADVTFRSVATPPAGSAGAEDESLVLFESETVTASHSGEYEYDLSTRKPALGTLITLTIAARDEREPEPNVGVSREVRLRVVSTADVLRQVDAEQRLLREELERLRQLEQNALEQTGDLKDVAENVGSLDPRERDKLQATETTQRRAREKALGANSIQQRVRELAQKLAANRIQDLDTQKRLALVDSEMSRIGEQHLSEIERLLGQARKAIPRESTVPESPSTNSPTEEETPPSTSDPGESPTAEVAQAPGGTGQQAPPSADAKPTPAEAKPATELVESLAGAEEHEQQVVESLDAMLEQLDKWESVAEVVHEARELEQRQLENQKEVQQLADQTLGKETEDLTGEERAELAQASREQDEIRRQLERLEQKMRRQSEKIAANDPAASEAMKQAVEQSQQSNTTGTMSQAAEDIEQNRLADAGQRQKESADSLRQLVQSLEDREEDDLKRLVKELRQAEEDLAQIRDEQKRLRKATEEAEQIADKERREEELRRLARRQEELRRQSQEFGRRLSRLQAKKASARSGRAAGRMDEASQAMQQGDGGEAGEQQEDALEQLEQAQQDLAQQRQEAEQKLAEEMLAKVADTIRDIEKRQRSITEEVERLDEARQEKGNLSRGQLQSVLGLSRAEAGLAKESHALRERLSEAKVFDFVLEEAVDLMNTGADQLGNKTTGAETQENLERAGRRFAQLLLSLRDDPAQNAGQGQNQGGGQGQGGQQGGGQDGIPPIAQIKLLKSLQTELLEDTRSLAEKRGDPDAPVDERFETLARRQGRLADIVRDMMTPADDQEGSDLP